jgi:hypothetical protein
VTLTQDDVCVSLPDHSQSIPLDQGNAVVKNLNKTISNFLVAALDLKNTGV